MVKVSSRLARVVLASVVGLIAGAACTDTDSATNLYTIGPPMVSQVLLTDSAIDQFGNPSTPRVFGFGTNVAAAPAIVHPVTSAVAAGNHLRIIIDHLLLGNNLEEIQCRGVIDDDAYSHVPDAATPDDIARCSVPQDVLPSTCTGDNAVCICTLPAGCNAGGTLVPMGESVGVLDANQDGAADDTRFIKGAVGIQCGAVSVPIDLDNSYWNPSGDQQEPAMGGFDALGPAIVLTPSAALPTNVSCGLVFDPSVVDKVGLQVCAPPDGDVLQGCTPPDVSAFSFKVEPLTLTVQGVADGDTGVLRNSPVIAASNVPLDPASISGITVLENGAPYTTVAVTVVSTTANSVITVRSTVATGFAASTMYTVTYPAGPTGIRDANGSPLPAPVVVSFTTGTI